jgi:hypothetical protein
MGGKALIQKWLFGETEIKDGSYLRIEKNDRF